MHILPVLHPFTTTVPGVAHFNLIVPKIKGQARHTFFNTAIRHWNLLPNSIKETNKSPQFKSAVKTIFQNKQD